MYYYYFFYNRYYSFIQWIARIQIAVVMEFVSRVLVSVKKAGKAWIATKWIKTPYSAYQTVRVTERSIWKHRRVSVNLCGLATIVRKVHAFFRVLLALLKRS